MRKLKTIQQVLNSNLCIGCGLCAAVAPETWNIDESSDLPRPIQIGPDTKIANSVCPAIHGTKKLLAESRQTFPDLTQVTRMGLINKALIGHSQTSQRASSSSGGMLTEYLCEILDSGMVDAVIHVAQKVDSSGFEYVKSKTSEEVRLRCKTRYFPVDLRKLSEFLVDEKRVALVGNPCFTSSARRLAKSQPETFGAITHFVSFFCGHWKSKGWTEYLVANSNLPEGNLVDFRSKIENRPAGKYGYEVQHGEQSQIRLMSDVSNSGWQFGLFKPLLCDFCDDVGSELADIVFGDAWIKPESEDSKGTSVVLVRSTNSLEALYSAARKGLVAFTELPIERLLESQNATLRHRQDGMSARLALTKITGLRIPPVRRRASVVPSRTNLVSLARYRLSKRSHLVWNEVRGSENSVKKFNDRLKFEYLLFRIASKIPSRRKI